MNSAAFIELDVHSSDSDYLDCVSDNIGIVLNSLGVRGTRALLASPWYFDFDPVANRGLPYLSGRPLAERIREQTGCRLETRSFERGRHLETIRRYLSAGRPIIVFGDSYEMPWLAYCGKEHFEHTFVITDLSDDGQSVRIADAFSNRTEWGTIAPQTLEVKTDIVIRAIEELQAPEFRMYLVLERVGEERGLNVAATVAGNARSIARLVGDERAIHRFADYYRQRADKPALARDFVTACWVVSRARALHALWLADIGAPPDLLETFRKKIATPWRQICEFGFVTMKKLAEAGSVPDSLFGMLEQRIAPAELEAAGKLLEWAETQERGNDHVDF